MIKLQFLPISLILLFCLNSIAQTNTGKKATLNEDGTITVEKVTLPDNLTNNRSSTLPADLLFSFGKAANPGIKNSRGVTLADLDNDGTEEIIYGIDTTLYVLNGDGTIKFEKAVLGPILLPPSVADLDEDGNLEIIFNTGYPTTVGRVYATDNEGNDLPGWPLNFADHWMINAPAIADVDGDGTLDIVTGERAGSTQGFIHALNMDGTEINDNWPVEVAATPAFTPSIGDVNNDGNNEVVIAASSAGMYIFDSQGAVLPGFPLVDPTVRYSYQSPILVDLDGDGDLEIVGSNHGDDAAFYVLNHDATYSWRIPLGGWTYSPSTVLDVEQDGVYEIFMSDRNTSGDGSTPLPTVYGLAPDGSNLPDFPIEKYGGTEGVLSIADINNDDVLDIIFPSVLTDTESIGYIHAYSLDGSGELDGFPLRPYGFTFLNGAVLGDVDNDGMMDLTANSFTLTFGSSIDSTFVNTYNLNVPYDASKIVRNGYKGSNLRDGLVADEILGVNSFSEDINISVSPNPSSGTLQFILPLDINNAQVTLYSIDGKIVFTEKIDIKENMMLHYDFQRLQSGMYLIKISEGKRTFTGKWLKN